MGAIDVKQTQEHELTLEWDSSASNDMLADSTLALITGIDKSPASVKRTSGSVSSTNQYHVACSYVATSLALGFPFPPARGA